MSADQQGKGHPDPDWLGECDAWAADAEPFQDGMFVPNFFLIRYPKLRPRHHPKALDEVVDRATGMAGRVRSEGVLEGLLPQQERELGALLCDIDSDYQYNDEQQSRHEHRAEAAKQGSGRRGRLNGKLKKAADALDELADYLDEIHRRFPIPAWVIARRTDRRSVARAREDAARYRSMTMADEEIPRLQEMLDGIAQPHPEFKRRPQIKREATTQLTSFFVTGCKCFQKEADLRTSEIGNHLWKWGDKVRRKHEGEDKPRAAEAARARRRRQKSRPPS